MINNYLRVLLLCLLVFVGCEDVKGPQPSGTLNITISIPGYAYLDYWWDYASKYEIYIENKLKSEASFKNYGNRTLSISSTFTSGLLSPVTRKYSLNL